LTSTHQTKELRVGSGLLRRAPGLHRPRRIVDGIVGIDVVEIDLNLRGDHVVEVAERPVTEHELVQPVGFNVFVNHVTARGGGHHQMWRPARITTTRV
jgi:hypothetical protein